MILPDKNHTLKTSNFLSTYENFLDCRSSNVSFYLSCGCMTSSQKIRLILIPIYLKNGMKLD